MFKGDSFNWYLVGRVKRIYFSPSLHGSQRLVTSLHEVVCRTETVIHASQFMWTEYACAVLYSCAFAIKEEREYNITMSVFRSPLEGANPVSARCGEALFPFSA